MKAIGLLLVLFGIGITVVAHPAQAVKAEYNSAKMELKITAEHSVSKPADHFINKIEVFVDGEKVITQTFKSQKDAKSQEVVYTLFDVKKGSKIKVTTVCNKIGIKNTEITVE